MYNHSIIPEIINSEKCYNIFFSYLQTNKEVKKQSHIRTTYPHKLHAYNASLIILKVNN